MSFALTTPQILARTKTVTRRTGWLSLEPGEAIQAIEKGQGLKKGEQVRRLCVIRILSVRRERLDRITPADVEREGFPGRSVLWFCDMFMKSHGMTVSSQHVTRIEFEFVDEVRS